MCSLRARFIYSFSRISPVRHGTSLEPSVRQRRNFVWSLFARLPHPATGFDGLPAVSSAIWAGTVLFGREHHGCTQDRRAFVPVCYHFRRFVPFGLPARRSEVYGRDPYSVSRSCSCDDRSTLFAPREHCAVTRGRIPPSHSTAVRGTRWHLLPASSAPIPPPAPTTTENQVPTVNTHPTLSEAITGCTEHAPDRSIHTLDR